MGNKHARSKNISVKCLNLSKGSAIKNLCHKKASNKCSDACALEAHIKAKSCKKLPVVTEVVITQYL